LAAAHTFSGREPPRKIARASREIEMRKCAQTFMHLYRVAGWRAAEAIINLITVSAARSCSGGAAADCDLQQLLLLNNRSAQPHCRHSAAAANNARAVQAENQFTDWQRGGGNHVHTQTHNTEK
jgi:hypothetical protein